MQTIAKKIIPYLFILITLVGVGFFGFVEKTGAQTAANGDCTITVTSAAPINRFLYTVVKRTSSTECAPVAELEVAVAKEKYGGFPKATGDWKEVVKENSQAGGAASTNTEFENRLDGACGKDPTTWFDGCILKLFYYTYFQIPALLLWLSAQIFNALISLVIQSSMYTADFIATAWGVVRDISNIFFILVLLYIAIKIILDMGGHEAKQMIAKVVIMALLINFSMFFTKIVIDTSNILALVFYNKLDTTYKDSSGNRAERPNTPSTPYKEKDISGAMYKNFNATTLLSKEFLDEIQTTKIDGKDVKGQDLPFSLTFGIIVIAGSIMLWAAYTFFVAGIFFLGRLIELWVLIIFSPFAFMSFPVPFLNSVSFVGWNEWSKKLIATSFMAPIFMFFMYLIFKLLETNIFNSFTSGKGAMVNLLNIIIPAMIIMALLKQGTSFAKKGGGMFGEIIMTGAKVVGGLALGAATGGVAMAGTATVGRLGAKIANSETAKRWEREGKFGSSLLRSGAKSMSSASFDIRGVKIAGKTLGSATGMGVGNARTGGFVERKKEQIAKRQKRAEELKMGENTEEKLKLDTAEEKLKRVKLQFEPDLEKFDKAIAAAREDLNDAKNSGDIVALEKAKKELADAKDGKKALREKMGEDGVSLKGAEEEVHHITYDIKVKNAKRIEEYAKLQESFGERAKGFVLSGGIYTKKEAREAAHKIRMEAKIEEVGGKKGHGGDDHGSGGGHAPATDHGPKPAPAPKSSAPAKGGGDDHGHKH